MAFGRLERSQGPQPMSDINMTPLVDIMLVLVVILIITAPLLASSLRLDLPRTDAARPGDSAVALTVVLDKSGQVWLADKPVDSAQLAARLEDTARRAPQTEIHLRADAAVPYGRIVEVMGMAQKVGLNRIAFAAEAAPVSTSGPGGAQRTP